MKKKRIKKPMLVFTVIIFCWMLFAQSCMKFRISDTNAKKQFADAGLLLQTAFTDADNFKLYYAKTGADTLPTLLFVHGSPGSWDAFKNYMMDKELLTKYRMVSIDRPGFGYSEFGNAKNLQQQSAIISVLLKQLENGKPFCIIGHSLGGPLAIKLAADNPDFFDHIVLLAASVDPALEKPEKWRFFLHSTPFRLFLPGAFKPSNSEIWYLKKDLLPLAEDFKLIRAAVWIVHGDKDSFVPVGNAAYAKKMLVNARKVHTTILNGAPHFIPWEPWYKDVKKILLSIGM